MTNAEHPHLTLDDFIHGDLRPGRKHEFSGIGNQPDPPAVGKSLQRGDATVNGLGDTLGSCRIVLADALYDVG